MQEKDVEATVFRVCSSKNAPNRVHPLPMDAVALVLHTSQSVLKPFLQPFICELTRGAATEVETGTLASGTETWMICVPY